MSADNDCIFCKIARGEIPSQKVYEDEDLLAFKDIRPAAPIHLLIIPRVHVPTLADATEAHAHLLSRMMLLAPRLAQEQGAANGFRVVVNNGPDGGQEVYHLHLHVLGGPRPWRVMG
jgi:histidine triad (HIT) family protein